MAAVDGQIILIHIDEWQPAEINGNAAPTAPPDQPPNHASPANAVQPESANPTPKPTPRKIKRSDKQPGVKKSAASKGSTASAAASVDEPRWYVVQPSKSKPSSSGPATAPVPPSSDARPRVWAENRAELFAVVPELREAVNGISWSHSETPILILEGNNTWPEDRWQSRTTFPLTILRDFSCPRSTQSHPPVQAQTTHTADNDDMEMSIVTAFQTTFAEGGQQASDANASCSGAVIGHPATSVDWQSHSGQADSALQPDVVAESPARGDACNRIMQESQEIVDSSSSWFRDVTDCDPSHSRNISAFNQAQTAHTADNDDMEMSIMTAFQTTFAEGGQQASDANASCSSAAIGHPSTNVDWQSHRGWADSALQPDVVAESPARGDACNVIMQESQEIVHSLDLSPWIRDVTDCDSSYSRNISAPTAGLRLQSSREDHRPVFPADFSSPGSSSMPSAVQSSQWTGPSFRPNEYSSPVFQTNHPSNNMPPISGHQPTSSDHRYSPPSNFSAPELSSVATIPQDSFSTFHSSFGSGECSSAPVQTNSRGYPGQPALVPNAPHISGQHPTLDYRRPAEFSASSVTTAPRGPPPNDPFFRCGENFSIWNRTNDNTSSQQQVHWSNNPPPISGWHPTTDSRNGSPADLYAQRDRSVNNGPRRLPPTGPSVWYRNRQPQRGGQHSTFSPHNVPQHPMSDDRYPLPSQADLSGPRTGQTTTIAWRRGSHWSPSPSQDRECSSDWSGNHPRPRPNRRGFSPNDASHYPGRSRFDRGRRPFRGQQRRHPDPLFAHGSSYSSRGNRQRGYPRPALQDRASSHYDDARRIERWNTRSRDVVEDEHGFPSGVDNDCSRGYHSRNPGDDRSHRDWREPSSSGYQSTSASITNDRGYDCQRVDDHPRAVAYTSAVGEESENSASNGQRIPTSNDWGYDCQQVGDRPRAVAHTSAVGEEFENSSSNVQRYEHGLPSGVDNDCSPGYHSRDAEDDRGRRDWREPSSSGYQFTSASITNDQGYDCQRVGDRSRAVAHTSAVEEVSQNSASNVQGIPTSMVSSMSQVAVPDVVSSNAAELKDVELSEQDMRVAVDAVVSSTTTQLQDVELCEQDMRVIADAVVSSTTTELQDVDFCDPKMPDGIPPEIQALIDSYERGIPIVVIMSGDCKLMPLRLDTPYAYSYMGFFRLAKFSSKSVPLSSRRDLPEHVIQGRVQWQFILSWSAGGEDFLKDQSRSHPWWSPDTREDVSLALVNSSWRDLTKDYTSYLPNQLHDEFVTWKGVFPRGWHCMGCGKLNEQYLLRHRSCSHCQLRVGLSGYAIALDQSRDWEQQAQVYLPYDLYPDHVETSAVIWDDGMRTFTYVIRDDAVAKHIFTCNRPLLQREATVLLREIQIHVELARQRDVKTPGPYFTYLAGNESKAVAWEHVPACVKQARELLCHRGRYHGENEDISVNGLTIMGWATTGTKTEKISATKSGVIILCLGADVVLSLVPKSGFSSSSDTQVDDDELEYPPTDLEMETDNVDGKKADSRGNRLVVHMVHGDVLMLSGDDFQCRLKRTGTSILLIGSCSRREGSAMM